MRVLYHPDFPKDLLRFGEQYGAISRRLEVRFRTEVDDALIRIKSAPTAAGHFLKTGSTIVTDIRRRNLASFPHFILYGLHGDLLIIGAVIPSASDPLTWLTRFSNPE
jgi:hypothetical protein